MPAQPNGDCGPVPVAETSPGAAGVATSARTASARTGHGSGRPRPEGAIAQSGTDDAGHRIDPQERARSARSARRSPASWSSRPVGLLIAPGSPHRGPSRRDRTAGSRATPRPGPGTAPRSRRPVGLGADQRGDGHSGPERRRSDSSLSPSRQAAAAARLGTAVRLTSVVPVMPSGSSTPWPQVVAERDARPVGEQVAQHGVAGVGVDPAPAGCGQRRPRLRAEARGVGQQMTDGGARGPGRLVQRQGPLLDGDQHGQGPWPASSPRPRRTRARGRRSCRSPHRLAVRDRADPGSKRSTATAA